MRINYLLGKTVSTLERFILSYPVWKFLPYRKGNNLVYDLKHYSRDSIGVILDVGANVGQSATLYHQVFRNAGIYSFEPVSATFSKLQDTVSSLKRVKTFRLAFGEEEGNISIALQSDSEVNSLLATSSDSNSAMEVLSVKRMDDFCAQQGIKTIDLLKIDVEGFEIQVLSGASALLDSQSVNFILVEAGWIKSDQLKTHFSVLETYLTEKGYMLSGIYETFRWGPRKAYAGFSNVLFVRKSYFEN